jgi:hypothetical protein
MIIKFLSGNRSYYGDKSVKRSPRIGEVGTIVHLVEKEGVVIGGVVEKTDAQGLTIWMADFAAEELKVC